MATLEELNRRFEEAKPNLINSLARAIIPLPDRVLHMRYDELLNSCARGIQELQTGVYEITDRRLQILERFIAVLEGGTRQD